MIFPRSCIHNDINISTYYKCNYYYDEFCHISQHRYQGQAEAALRTLFADAYRNAPSLILIDDIELLCANRADTSGDLGHLRKRIVSCLLTLIEGVTSTDSNEREAQAVFILATSSNPRDIDPAMRRPGRLDREIALEVPSTSDRCSILRSTLRALRIPVLPSDISECGNKESAVVATGLSLLEGGISSNCVEEVARVAHGMVGSDLLLVCKEACLLAVERLTGEGVGVVSTSSSGDGTRVQPIVLSDDLDFSALSLDGSSESASISSPFSPCHAGSGDMCVEPEERTVHPLLVDSVHPVQNRDLLLASSRVKPSAMREVAVEVPQVKWADIGGMDSVKQSLREVEHGDVLRSNCLHSVINQ